MIHLNHRRFADLVNFGQVGQPLGQVFANRRFLSIGSAQCASCHAKGDEGFDEFHGLNFLDGLFLNACHGLITGLERNHGSVPEARFISQFFNGWLLLTLFMPQLRADCQAVPACENRPCKPSVTALTAATSALRARS